MSFWPLLAAFNIRNCRDEELEVGTEGTPVGAHTSFRRFKTTQMSPINEMTPMAPRPISAQDRPLD